ncbi:MAG TPA: hypothetical protein VNP73_09455 [Actinomycetota bacterium]|nr:hypothetical protein [Actinomycetota bacterium]
MLVLLGACNATPSDPNAAPRVPQTSRTSDRAERKPTKPHPRVINGAFGFTERRIDRAIADLKRLGLWNRLTDHLYVLDIGSRLGTENVPEDRHLADAYSTGFVDEQDSGQLCDLMFYATAIKRDLRRWRGFYSQGLARHQPLPLGRYWTQLLAHELAHCLPGPHGESVAQAWEARVRRAYERSDAGSKS